MRDVREAGDEGAIRVDTKVDGSQNDKFNLVRSGNNRKNTDALAKRMKKSRAFVAVALRASDASYAAYFGEFASFPTRKFRCKTAQAIDNLNPIRATKGSKNS
jgi:hypothetical protein